MHSRSRIGLAVAALALPAIGLAIVANPLPQALTPLEQQPAATRVGQLSPPAGFARAAAAPDTWAAWLRALPLKPAGSPVRLYNGALKPQQDKHEAVIDVDIGARDLQQCADAIIRLRAEWLWSNKRLSDIAFTYTGGGRVAYVRWAQGERPSADGRVWKTAAGADPGYGAFRKYLEHVMIYAGTASLEKELTPVRIDEIAIGDVFIKGGFPGHAILVVDLARHPKTGETRMLLAQSHMPAQDIHVLKNPASADGSPWYGTDFGERLVTPDWTFARSALRRWPTR
jgi:Domain of unknown function (4846)